MKNYSIVFILLLILIVSCGKKDAPVKRPEIRLVSVSPMSVKNGEPKDTLLISLQYNMAAEGIAQSQVFFKDSRNEDAPIAQFFPEDMTKKNLPQGQVNLSGTILLRIPASQYLVLRPSHPDGDTLKYKIFVTDHKNNTSDTLVTPDIYILP